MKLRNKQTGEIVEGVDIDLYTDRAYLKVSHGAKNKTYEYNSIKDFTDHWEDVPEEPKDEMYWYIEPDGEVMDDWRSWHIGQSDYEWEQEKEAMKRVGNFFATKEQAIKARDKLLAWQRIKEDLVSLHWQDEKDGEFSVWGQFYGHMLANDAILNIHRKDLDLLFPGGEE